MQPPPYPPTQGPPSLYLGPCNAESTPVGFAPEAHSLPGLWVPWAAPQAPRLARDSQASHALDTGQQDPFLALALSLGESVRQGKKALWES